MLGQHGERLCGKGAGMRTRIFAQTSKAFVAAFASTVCASAFAQGSTSLPLETAVIRPALNAILSAFETHSLVGLSDSHGLAQEMELYEELIRDPRFARKVGNVVVEFGGAARQDVIDGYVNGEMVPYTELRQVWIDTVQRSSATCGDARPTRGRTSTSVRQRCRNPCGRSCKPRWMTFCSAATRSYKRSVGRW